MYIPEFWVGVIVTIVVEFLAIMLYGISTVKRNRKGDRNNEKVGKERSKGEHEEERHGAVL